MYSSIMYSFANYSNSLSPLYTFPPCYADMLSYILHMNMYVLLILMTEMCDACRLPEMIES